MSRISRFTQVAIIPDDNHPSAGVHGKSRKWSQSFSIAVREGISAEIMRDWCMAVLEGYQPIMQRDERIDGGWKVIKNDDGKESSMAEKQWAWLQIVNRGWGQPIQQHYLDADLRQHNTLEVVDTSKLNGLSYALKEKLVALLNPPDVVESDVIEAELVEVEKPDENNNE